jgi:hypothetical protein
MSRIRSGSSFAKAEMVGSVHRCQIDSDDARLGAVVALELRSQLLQAVLAPRRQHHGEPVGRERPRELRPDSRRRAGHDRPASVALRER